MNSIETIKTRTTADIDKEINRLKVSKANVRLDIGLVAFNGLIGGEWAALITAGGLVWLELYKTAHSKRRLKELFSERHQAPRAYISNHESAV